MSDEWGDELRGNEEWGNETLLGTNLGSEQDVTKRINKVNILLLRDKFI